MVSEHAGGRLNLTKRAVGVFDHLRAGAVHKGEHVTCGVADVIQRHVAVGQGQRLAVRRVFIIHRRAVDALFWADDPAAVEGVVEGGAVDRLLRADTVGVVGRLIGEQRVGRGGTRGGVISSPGFTSKQLTLIVIADVTQQHSNHEVLSIQIAS